MKKDKMRGAAKHAAPANGFVKQFSAQGASLPARPDPGEEPSTKPSKLYLRRLEEQKLPQEPLVAKVAAPSQFKLAQLASILASSGHKPAQLGDHVTSALRLWNAAGGLLIAEKQADVLVRGLLHFNGYHWRRHAEALVRAYDDRSKRLGGEPPSSGEAASACERASKMAQEVWRKLQPSNGDVFDALFYASKESREKQMERFRELIAFARERLEIVGNDLSVRSSLDEGPDEQSRLELSVAAAYAPLAPGKWAAGAVMKLVREKYAASDKFFAASTLAEDPAVARWLIVKRQWQAVEAQRR